MIPFPDPKLCPRTPGHKLYYKARRRFCKMKNTEKQKEAAAQRTVPQPRAQPRSSPLVAMTFLYRKQFHGGPPCPCDAGFIMTKGRMEKQGEHFCLHFLRGCAILLYTDECISPCAIVAQLDRAFGSDPEGQRFESSRSHQEKPRHNVPGFFFFCATGRIRTARPCAAG